MHTPNSKDNKERRALDAIEHMLDRELAKGDDEFYESFRSKSNKNEKVMTGSHGKRRRKGRKM